MIINNTEWNNDCIQGNLQGYCHPFEQGNGRISGWMEAYQLQNSEMQAEDEHNIMILYSDKWH